ncbi:plastocyanin/azurin family copper-binding protein [Aliifodinibius sp. S!AR15-10]|uniref:plastocyanin/azurin family copper-binding protein n=1 Tax=Aliifodinibius sp. S!AR15-10 TaxID=2950437 RepID=UPI002866C25B|nr:plastocyanin/azurin family copper-binding protein [Aliifodinibius sp. S!AR15-10]MDR8389691.1 plastocyanin/azurin family copper-binding protein [Aliifodinibius sp. S!AR15-10]
MIEINNLDDAIIENRSFKTNGGHTEYGDTTVVEIRSEGIELSYSVTEIRAKAGSILKVVYSNDSDMTHNIVLVKGEDDIRPVGVAALQAVGNDWIPENEMDRILAYSELAYSGDTVELVFEVPPPGTYPYICTYSAHWTQMQGRLISTE